MLMHVHVMHDMDLEPATDPSLSSILEIYRETPAVQIPEVLHFAFERT
jgi:hypothetical protein